MNLKRQKKTYNNMLVVSGTGRNTGKTTFVCKLIEKFKELDCIAVKISSHFHDLPEDVEFLKDSDNYQIILEKKKEGRKDSQKMLAAGARNVFYVQVKDGFLSEVLEYLDINKEQPFIFESGAIAKNLPGALHICFLGKEHYKPCSQPDFVMNLQSENLEFFLESIQFENNKFTVYANA